MVSDVTHAAAMAGACQAWMVQEALFFLRAIRPASSPIEPNRPAPFAMGFVRIAPCRHFLSRLKWAASERVNPSIHLLILAFEKNDVPSF